MRKPFGVRLRDARDARGLTQAQLARESGVTQTSVSRYERGMHVAGQRNLNRLAHVLQVTVSELIGDESRSERIERMLDEQLSEIRELKQTVENALALLGRPAPPVVYGSDTTKPPRLMSMTKATDCAGCGAPNGGTGGHAFDCHWLI